MKDLTGNINNPIWEFLKRYPGYQFSTSYKLCDGGESLIVLTVANETRKIQYRKYLSAWCVSDPIAMIEQLFYHFDECAREVYKKENE